MMKFPEIFEKLCIAYRTYDLVLVEQYHIFIYLFIICTRKPLTMTPTILHTIVGV